MMCDEMQKIESHLLPQPPLMLVSPLHVHSKLFKNNEIDDKQVMTS